MSTKISIKTDSVVTTASVLLASAAFVLYFPLVLNRLDHNDFMYAAAPLLWQATGQLYSDVPFVQAPLSILIPNAIHIVFGTEQLYLTARLLSAFLILFGVVLLALTVSKKNDITAAAILCALLLSNSYILSAANEIGSYALPFFMISASCFLTSLRIRLETKVLLISFAIGLAASAKLNHIVLLPGLLLLAYDREPVTLRLLFISAIGVTAGTAPTLYYFLKSPEAFFFQNITFHMLTNEARGLTMQGSLLDIYADTRKFFIDLSIPLSMLSVALLFGTQSRLTKVTILITLCLAYLLAVAPRVLFAQYLAVMAGMVLFFCVRMITELDDEKRRIANALLIFLGALQLSVVAPRSNLFEPDSYPLFQTISAQEKSKRLINDANLDSHRVFTTQPLFYLDTRADYHPAMAAGPFWLRVYDGLPFDHEQKKDLRTELLEFEPDIVVFGYYEGDAGLAAFGRLDDLVKEYAVSQKFQFSTIGSVDDREIILGYRSDHH